jgi:hypothetical protein
MATYQKEGASIECGRSKIAVRKLITLSLIEIGGVRYFRYKSKISGRATILEELDPKICRISKASFLDSNDELSADVIEIYSEKKIKLENQANYSNVHGMQVGESKSFTYAKISQPWKFINQSDGLKLIK